MKYEIKDVGTFLSQALELARGKVQGFRGLSDVNYPLLPSIGRHLIIDPGKEIPKNCVSTLEFQMVDEFRAYSLPFLTMRDANIIEIMVRAQHHGVPTRLMDWTLNPLVALYFATKNTSKESDGVVYMSMLPKSYHQVPGAGMNPFSVIEDCHLLPLHIDARITAQSSIFTLHSNPSVPMDKTGMHQFWFKAERRGLISSELDLLGIHAGTMFPGLSGIGEHIKSKTLGGNWNLVFENKPDW